MALTTAQIAANKARNATAQAGATPVAPIKPPVKAPVTEQSYLNAVAKSTPTGAEINKATAAGVNPVTGTSIEAGKAVAPKAVVTAQGTPVGMEAPKATTPTVGQTKVVDGRTLTYQESGVSKGTFFWGNQAADKANVSQYESWKMMNPEKSYQDWETETGTTQKAVASSQAVKSAAEKLAGDRPTPTPPGENETPEQASARRISDAQSLAAWWEKVGTASQKEVGAAVGAVSDLKTQMETMGETFKGMFASLNQTNPGSGDAVQKAIESAITANKASVSGEQMAAIQKLANTETDPTKIQAGVAQILGNATSKAQALASTGFSQVSGGYMKGNSFVPTGPDGKITGNQADLPPDISGMDLFMLQYATENDNADTSVIQTLRAINDMKSSMDRIQTTTKNKINRDLEAGGNELAMSETETINSINAERRQQELERDGSLNASLTKEGEQEAFWNGQLEAWGASDSIAALSLMTKNKLKFLQERDQITQQYSANALKFNEQEVSARNAYVVGITKLYNGAQDSQDNLTNNMFDNLDKALTLTTNAYENRDIKKQQALLNFSKNVYTEQQDKRKEAMDLYKVAQERQFNAMASGIKESGGVLALDANGMPTYLMGSDGKPLKSMEFQKFEAEMGKWEHAVVDGKLVFFDANGRQVTPSDNGIPDSKFTGKEGGTGINFTVNGKQFSVGGEYGAAQGNNAECVGGGRLFNNDLPTGLFTLSDKRNIYSGITDVNQARIGDTLFFATKQGDPADQSGHVTTLIAKNDSTKMGLVIESNYNLDGKFTMREVDLSKVDKDPITGKVGIFRGKNPDLGSLQQLWNQYDKSTFFTDTQKQVAEQSYGSQYVYGKQPGQNVIEKQSSFMDTIDPSMRSTVELAMTGTPKDSGPARADLAEYDSTHGTNYAGTVNAAMVGDYSKMLGEKSKLVDALSMLPQKSGIDQTDLLKNAATRIANGDTNYVQKLVLDGIAKEPSTGIQFTANKIFLESLADMREAVQAVNSGTGLSDGTMQKLRQTMGFVGNDKMAMARQLADLSLQSYVKAQSGVAFSEKEFAKYEASFPSITKRGALNDILLGGLTTLAKGRMDALVGSATGDMVTDYSDLITPEQKQRYFGYGNDQETIDSIYGN